MRTIGHIVMGCVLIVPAGCALSSLPTEPFTFAPTPYTAQQIRDATHVGRTYEFLIERPDGPAARRRMVFVAVTRERATVESVMIDDKGKISGEPKRTDSTWEELRDHAKYPKAATTIATATATTPAGTFPCHRYMVVEAGEGGVTRTVALFADELPGPPVELRKEVAGRLAITMTLLRHDPGTGAGK